MKNTVIFFFLTCMTIWLIARGNADAAAFTMGQLQTVSSDGSLDVLRNPSLLASQAPNNSIGVLFLSVPYSDRLYSYNATMASSVTHPRYHDSKYLTGSIYLSYGRKTAHGTVGVAVDADNPYQAIYNRLERKYYGINGSSLTYDYTAVSGNLMKISPRLVISYGMVVSGNHSIGIQWTLGYSRARGKNDFIYVNNGVIAGKHWATKKTEDVSAECSLGYSYRNAGSQAGLMLRSGRFNWEKTKINFGHGDFANSIFFPGRVSEPFYLQYDRGFSILAGGYQQLAPFIAVALEGEYEIPIHYNYKAVRYDETTALYGILNNMTIRKTGLYSIRAGFEILPSGPATISLGGKMSTARERRKGKKIQESVNTDMYAGTIGLDIKVIDTMLIMVGSRLVYTHERTRISASNDYSGSLTRDGLARIFNVDLFLGMSGGF